MAAIYNRDKEMMFGDIRIANERQLVEFALARGLDIRNADLSNLDLRDLDFSHRSLDGVIFDGADIRGSNFERAVIAGASFKAARANGCTNWRDLKFKGGELEGLRLG